jgi:hypothetical protein
VMTWLTSGVVIRAAVGRLTVTGTVPIAEHRGGPSPEM